MGLIQVAPPVAGISLYRRNVIINGCMSAWSRGAGPTSITVAGQFVADRFLNAMNSAVGAMTVTLDGDVPAGQSFTSSAKYTVTAPDSSLGSSEYAFICQRIEGVNIRPLLHKPFTLSFWIKSSKTGTYALAFSKGKDSTDVRRWVTSFTIDQANTWEFKTITPNTTLSPSTIGGTWDLSNGTGLSVIIGLAWGSSFQTSAIEQWQTSDVYSPSGCVNWLDTNGATLRITGVQLEAGTVVTPFEMIPYQYIQLECGRYYESGGATYWSGDVSSGGVYYKLVPMMYAKRIAPLSGNMVITAVVNSGFPATAPTFNGASTVLFQVYHTANATGSAGYFGLGWTCDVELAWGT
jgi:hypothetical protein